jgi:hypothetical protein
MVEVDSGPRSESRMTFLSRNDEGLGMRRGKSTEGCDNTVITCVGPNLFGQKNRQNKRKIEFIRPGMSVGQAREWSNEFDPTGLLVGRNDEGWGEIPAFAGMTKWW